MKRVSVAYALPERQWLWQVELPDCATVADALEAARQIAARSDPTDQVVSSSALVPWDVAAVGIFGELCERTAIPLDGDRVELYRPLAADPRESRRARVARLRAAKRGAKS